MFQCFSSKKFSALKHYQNLSTKFKAASFPLQVSIIRQTWRPKSCTRVIVRSKNLKKHYKHFSVVQNFRVQIRKKSFFGIKDGKSLRISNSYHKTHETYEIFIIHLRDNSRKNKQLIRKRKL